MSTETVLVVGASGNIGASAVTAALRSGRKVLAVVRNHDSAEKLIKHVGSSQGITFVDADVMKDTGVQGVVDQVREGTLPAFQHVYSCVGGEYRPTPLQEITNEMLRYNMSAGFYAAFFAYRSTMPYLLSQAHPNSTWTVCTGAQGDIAQFPVPAMPQGALFSFATAACRENEKTNVRFNEVYLAFRVEVDEDAKKHGVTSASEFAEVYKQMLDRKDVKSSRVRVETPEDLAVLRFARKF